MSETLFEQARANSPKSFLEREYEVVGGGLIDGLGRAGGQTLQDIKTFGSNFANDWSGTTGGFLKDHWSEAAVGAAITFANPKKWVTSLLFAYSMRGLLTDTGRLTALRPEFCQKRCRHRLCPHNRPPWSSATKRERRCPRG